MPWRPGPVEWQRRLRAAEGGMDSNTRKPHVGGGRVRGAGQAPGGMCRCGQKRRPALCVSSKAREAV